MSTSLAVSSATIASGFSLSRPSSSPRSRGQSDTPPRCIELVDVTSPEFERPNLLLFHVKQPLNSAMSRLYEQVQGCNGCFHRCRAMDAGHVMARAGLAGLDRSGDSAPKSGRP